MTDEKHATQTQQAPTAREILDDILKADNISQGGHDALAANNRQNDLICTISELQSILIQLLIDSVQPKTTSYSSIVDSTDDASEDYLYNRIGTIHDSLSNIQDFDTTNQQSPIRKITESLIDEAADLISISDRLDTAVNKIGRLLDELDIEIASN